MSLPPNAQPPLDPQFLPAAAWNAAYQADLRQARDRAVQITLSLRRPDGSGSLWQDRLLPGTAPQVQRRNYRYLERRLKALAWMRGACCIEAQGLPAALLAELQANYRAGGVRAFDADFLGRQVFRQEFTITGCENLPDTGEAGLWVGGHRDGCRIGFDLGGSDRKCAAMRDGDVVFSEEIPWDPYFQQDPQYHLDGMLDSIQRAASHLPAIDAIGGSAAGVYINNEVRAGSLFRGVPETLFDTHVRPIFKVLAGKLGNPPMVVVNDGEVTALAGAMARNCGAVLGIAMGTSQAAGYVNPQGQLTPWLNELAFVPVDYADNAPRDEWSGDAGCGVQYFSQQAVARLLPASGLEVDTQLPAPEKLMAVQQAMQENQPGAEAVFRSIGLYLGWSLVHYAEFYDCNRVLLLGRVTSGPGGECIRETAETLLRTEFPQLAEKLTLEMPGETEKRHGQAAAAATLAALEKPAP